MAKKAILIVIVLIFTLNVFLLSSYSSDIEKVPYIYISISHGQAMGRMFGRDSIYVGYDGLIQKVKEEYGMADTVQKLQEGRLGNREISRLFSDIEKELTALLKKGKKADQKAPTDPGQQIVQEYFSASAEVEMFSADKKVISTNVSSGEDLTQLTTTIDKAIAGKTFLDISVERFIRTHMLRDTATIKQCRKDNLIHEVGINDLAQAKPVLQSISYERRLVPITGDNPFTHLKYFRWPYKWPYSVELEVNGKVYSVRNLIKGGADYEKN